MPPLAYAVDLVVKVSQPRYVAHIFNGFEHLACQIDSQARVIQKRPKIIVVSLIVEPGYINRVSDLVSSYEPHLDDVELHIMTPSGTELIRLYENKARSLTAIGLSEKTVNLLHNAGIHSVHDLTQTTRKYLKVYALGIGPVKVREIEDALGIEELSLADE